MAARREMKMDKKPRAASDAFRDSRLPEKSRRGRLAKVKILTFPQPTTHGINALSAHLPASILSITSASLFSPGC